MAELTLGIWIVTAFLGLYMWLIAGQAPQSGRAPLPTRLSPLMLFMHPFLALVGLTVWLVYVFTGAPEYTWIALADLVLVAVLGDVLAAKTVKHRREDTKHLTSTLARVREMDPEEGQLLVDEVVTSESQIPTVAILTHGAFALTTIGLVLAQAILTI